MMMLTHNGFEDAQLHAGTTSGVSGIARILIVCETDLDTEGLKSVFQKAGLASGGVGALPRVMSREDLID